MITEKPTKISLKSVDGKVEVLSQAIGVLNGKMEMFDEKLESFEKRMEAFDKRMGSFDNRLELFGASQGKMGVLMEAMDGKLSLMLEGYLGHDARMVRLENIAERFEER